ncbi:MAG TPA: GNAT family N-acetyltransferase [Pyrinomonadaceae bacterium]|nr:GNAT family N-acetyltransferase [Pyrinomonadaceae bacterium]
MTTKVLETARLVFRPYRPEDVEESVAMLTDAGVMRFVGDGVLDDAGARAMFKRTFTHVYATIAFDVWAVCEKGGGEIIGHAEIKPRKGAEDVEIVYLLRREAWGRGYATEIARRLVEYGFEDLKLRRVVATIDVENRASVRVVEKIGMRREGQYEDEHGTTLVYAIGRDDASSRGA